jgi:alpha-tubulin suppressor-like RCC1 family protein
MNDTVSRHTPTLIPSLSGVSQIACGQTHSMVLTIDSRVFSFGMNIVRVKYSSSTDNLVREIQIGRTTPTQIISLGTSVIQIATGQYHSLVLVNNGSVLSFGYNGQLGLGDYTSRLTPTVIPSLNGAIRVEGGWYSLVLMSDSRMYSFGYNGVGGKKTTILKIEWTTRSWRFNR